MGFGLHSSLVKQKQGSQLEVAVAQIIAVGLDSDGLAVHNQMFKDVQTKIKKNPRPRIREIAPIYLSVTLFNIIYNYNRQHKCDLIVEILLLNRADFEFVSFSSAYICSYQHLYVLFFSTDCSCLQISKSICDRLLGTNGKRRKKCRSISSLFYFHS